VSATAATSGGTTTITVLNAFDPSRITIGGIPATISGAVQHPDGTTTYTVVVPSNAALPLGTTACPGGATALAPTAFDVGYTSLVTTCPDVLTKGLLVSPPSGPVATTVWTFTPFIGTITPANPAATPPTPATVSVSPTGESVTIVNTGNTTGGAPPLMITSITNTSVGGPNGCSAFQITATPPAGASLNQCDALTISAAYNGQTTPSASADQCQITVTTNAGTKSFVLTGASH